ncbi:hypothetical protein QTP70_011741 [Hemibagrus guttatus]|uniref:Uncharacterized protein n=1 Tax=Hemibagrus guttatus TaxID=175788 RepID=A0AAE0V1C7_9TELE|nr:hypothetical protein QTP70_011741 [Hemibagrus guttatus]
MVSQFGSLGYTIMGKTADLTVVQKTIIDPPSQGGINLDASVPAENQLCFINGNPLITRAARNEEKGEGRNVHFSPPSSFKQIVQLLCTLLLLWSFIPIKPVSYHPKESFTSPPPPIVSNQALKEAEQIGQEILSNLHSDREKIQRSRDRLRETDANLGKSSRILSGMLRSSYRNGY